MAIDCRSCLDSVWMASSFPEKPFLWNTLRVSRKERDRKGVDVVRLKNCEDGIIVCDALCLCCIMFVFGKERDSCGSFVR